MWGGAPRVCYRGAPFCPFRAPCTLSSMNRAVGGGAERGKGGPPQGELAHAPHFDHLLLSFFCSSFSGATGDWRIADRVSLISCAFLDFRFWRSSSSYFLCCRIVDCIVVTFENVI